MSGSDVHFAHSEFKGASATTSTTSIMQTTEHNSTNGKLEKSSKLSAHSHNNRIVHLKGDGSFKSLTHWLLENQISFSFYAIALLLFAHFSVARAQPYTTKFLSISYYNPKTGNYAAGGDDFYFIGFCVVLYTGLRAGFMKYILAPLGKGLGISRKKLITRFAEQTWLLCYYSVSWTLGLYLYLNSEYYLNMRELFTDWPTRELPWLTKTYILAQWAFWLQQILVINIEERRKDHWQMFAHHIVTIVLIFTSYALHLTRVANLIMVLMDVADIFFPIAKCLKYLGHSTLCDIMFGVFMLSWFITRHACYMTTLWGIWAYMGDVIPVGCYHGSQDNLTGPTPLPQHGWLHMVDPFINPTGTICYSDKVKWWFLSALGFLQVLTIFWFFMIVRVAVRVLKGNGADDIRSDDESEEEENDGTSEYEGAEPFEQEEVGEEVGVEAIDLEGWKRRAGIKRTANSSGFGLPGHSDRKELLSRIGCEKQVD
ncbi:TLC domain-containing protein [Xylogone sp. PMI_703]|nr:TLC domain-containing protein [Xylogone sp. PMI_703]